LPEATVSTDLLVHHPKEIIMKKTPAKKTTKKTQSTQYAKAANPAAGQARKSPPRDPSSQGALAKEHRIPEIVRRYPITGTCVLAIPRSMTEVLGDKLSHELFEELNNSVLTSVFQCEDAVINLTLPIRALGSDLLQDKRPSK
jgi:hypothetical protein